METWSGPERVLFLATMLWAQLGIYAVVSSIKTCIERWNS